MLVCVENKLYIIQLHEREIISVYVSIVKGLTVNSNSQIRPTTHPPAKKGKKHLTTYNRLLFVYHLLLTVILVTFSESRS